MSTRFWSVAALALFVGAAGAAVGTLLASLADTADGVTSPLGKTIAQLDLKDVDGKTWTLADLKGNKAIVVVFVGTECPISNSYTPRLGELSKAFADKGVKFIAVNANRQDTPARVAAHAKEHAIPFPVLTDINQRTADHFGAHRTPETFVLDGQFKVVYHGRIDDRFGLGYQRAKAEREDLEIALEELLAGKPIAVAQTPLAGCIIGRAPTVALAKEPTVNYAKHVAPIIQNRCQECHREGQIGPMPLKDYDDVSSWSAMIREVVSEKRMPPWHADEKFHGQFTNERALTKTEYDTLLAWIDQGCPRGDNRDLPAPRQFADTWYIGKPDVVLKMDKEFTVPAKAPPRGVPYKYFVIQTKFDEDKWIQAAECKPGNRAVVHHIIAFTIAPGAVNAKGKFDPVDSLGMGMFAAYAPGDLGFVYPPGAARKIPKGVNVIFQVHYTPNGIECKDQSSVGIVFAKEPPKVDVQMRAISNMKFLIPPNADNHEVQSESTFAKDTVLFGLLPHMHLRGKDFKYDVVYPDGKTETILSVPRYDFGWQSTYHFKEPLKLPAGTKIKCLAHFNNSKSNPWNPDPTASVKFGEQTWEEMMIGFVDYAYVKQAGNK